MSRQEKRRRRRRHEARRIGVWTALVLVEMVVAAASAGVVAAIFVPMGYRERGYWAMGGEWLLVGAVFIAAYTVIHKAVCDKLEEG